MRHDFRTRQVAPLKEVPKGVCNCLECQKGRMYKQQYFDRMSGYNGGHTMDMDIDMHRELNHADDDGTADQYIGADLYATAPVTVYTDKGTKIKKVVQKGDFVGTVFSWVADPPMFMLEDNTFVKIEQGLYDKQKALDSLADKQALHDAQVETAAQKDMAANTNPFYKAGKTASSIVDSVASFNLDSIFGPLKWVAIALLAVILIGVFLRIKG